MTTGTGEVGRPTVPEKPRNTGRANRGLAEGDGGRKGWPKGNLPTANVSGHRAGTDTPSALERVRQAAGKDKQLELVAVSRRCLHHNSTNLESMRDGILPDLKRWKRSDPGGDGEGGEEETWAGTNGETLEGNLQDLAERLKRGGVLPQGEPGSRVCMNEGTTGGKERSGCGGGRGFPGLGRQNRPAPRPSRVLNAPLSTKRNFLDFSYGFRPGASQHQALDALYTGLLKKRKCELVLLRAGPSKLFACARLSRRFQLVKLPPRKGRSSPTGIESWAQKGATGS